MAMTGTSRFSVSFLRHTLRAVALPLRRLASTLVVAEHEGGALKNSSLSAVAAAAALGEGSTVSLLVGGSGPLLQQAVAHAAKAHPAITQVHNLTKNYLLLPRHRFCHMHS